MKYYLDEYKILIKNGSDFFLIEKGNPFERSLKRGLGSQLIQKMEEIKEDGLPLWVPLNILKRINDGPVNYDEPGVYVCGDTHSNIDMSKIHNWDEKKNLNKDDILIVLGDWAGLIGINQKGKRKDDKLLRKWVRESFTLLVQLGNHENYKTIHNLPIIEKFGGRVYEKKVYSYSGNKYEGSVYLMIRGEVYTINDETYFSMGGAKSYDPNEDYYWEEELPSDSEKEYALNNLKLVNFCVDYVITHTCPQSVGVELIKSNSDTEEEDRLSEKIYKDPIAIWFDRLQLNLTFKEWHFGHWHMDKVINGKFFCHYNNRPLRLPIT